MKTWRPGMTSNQVRIDRLGDRYFDGQLFQELARQGLRMIFAFIDAAPRKFPFIAGVLDEDHASIP
jgi:hypothetical protein